MSWPQTWIKFSSCWRSFKSSNRVVQVQIVKW